MIKANGKVIKFNNKEKNELASCFDKAIAEFQLNDTPMLRRFKEQPENCIVRLIPKSILNRFEVRVRILERELEYKSTDNKGARIRAEACVYGELFTNSLWDDFTFNATPYSPFPYTYNQCDAGHYSNRGETKVSLLTNPTSPMKTAGYYKKGEFKYKNDYSDECIHSYASLHELPFLSDLFQCSEEYYLVITFGYLRYETFNEYLGSSECSSRLFNNKVQISDDMLKELIPFDTYKRDYIYRMATPLHIYNASTHLDFLRLSYISTIGYLVGFENSDFNPFMLKGNVPRLYSILKSELNSKVRKNGRLLKTLKTMRYVFPVGEVKGGSLKALQFNLDTTKEGTKINSIKEFTFPNMTTLRYKPHDVSEDFIFNNLVGSPLISYGLNGILGLFLKDYTRVCCDGLKVERALISLDLNDLLDICDPMLNAQINRILLNGVLKNNFYSDWKCLNLLDIVKDLCVNSPISFAQFKSDFTLITDNIERKLNKLNQDDIPKYKIIPVMLLLGFVLYRLTGRLSGCYREKLLKYHPNVEISTNGVIDFTPTIDKFIKEGIVDLQNKCPHDFYKVDRMGDNYFGDIDDLGNFSWDMTDTKSSEETKNTENNCSSSDENTPFGDLDSFGNIPFDKERNSSDVKNIDINFGEDESEKSDGVDKVDDTVEDVVISDVNSFDFETPFGSPLGLNLSYEDIKGFFNNSVSKGVVNIDSEIGKAFNLSEMLKKDKLEGINHSENPVCHSECDTEEVEKGEEVPIVTPEILAGFTAPVTSTKNTEEFENPPMLSNEFTNPVFGEQEFDPGLKDYFVTSPFFDSNKETKDHILEDVFNPALDYSVLQIKSLVLKDCLSMDAFKKELLKIVTEKINSDDTVYSVYESLKHLF